MPAVFADTGYWIALLTPGDDLRGRATKLSITHEEQVIITTEMVGTEFLNNVPAGAAKCAGRLHRPWPNGEMTPMWKSSSRPAASSRQLWCATNQVWTRPGAW